MLAAIVVACVMFRPLMFALDRGLEWGRNLTIGELSRYAMSAT